MTYEEYEAARAPILAAIEWMNREHERHVTPLAQRLADIDAAYTAGHSVQQQGPPGNRIYLVCQSHLEVIDALLLASRLHQNYHAAPSVAQMSKWLERHATCGEGPDKYQLAHNHPMNWDQPVEGAPSPVAAGIKLALVKP